jgi:NarL family two-component system response regulator YdfI
LSAGRSGIGGGSIGEAAATVFIVAASDVVRAGLRSLIESDARFTVAGSAANLSEFAAAQGLEGGANSGVVVFDAERQEENAFDALRAFIDETDEGGSSAAFVLIGAVQSAAVMEALRAGVVRALLPGAASGSEIIAAVEAVSTGLFALDPEAFNALLSAPRLTTDEARSAHLDEELLSPVEPQLDALTPREREALDMLAEGLSNKEIAWRMKISEHTVKFHVASIFAKLGVSTRTEAVMQGIRRGLVMM